MCTAGRQPRHAREVAGAGRIVDGYGRGRLLPRSWVSELPHAVASPARGGAIGAPRADVCCASGDLTAADAAGALRHEGEQKWLLGSGAIAELPDVVVAPADDPVVHEGGARMLPARGDRLDVAQRCRP